MRGRHLAAAGLVAAAVTVATAGAASAAPPTVTCGSTVTGYARLTSDLTCASGDGVTLTGDATLDLRGHTLTGPNDGTGIGVVTSTTGRSKIVNGRIERWGRGIGGNLELQGRPVVDVRDVTFFSDITAIDAYVSTVTVDRSTFDDGERGVNVVFSSSATVTRSTFQALGEAGVYTDESLGATVSRSTFTGSSTGIRCGDACTVTHNVIKTNGEGVSTFGARLTATGNDFVSNDVGYAPGRNTGGREDVRGNRFLDNGAGVRIFGEGAGFQLHRNLFDGNGIGFLAQETEGDYSALLDRNTFKNNGDGVLATVGSPSLRRNSAVDNTRWGIYAPGAVDLGGNTASGNGNEPQCVGVVCS